MKNNNYVFWIGVLPEDSRVTDKFRYGDFSWMQYSKNTWEYWCKKNDVAFVHYDKPTRDDLIDYKVNWQRWLDVFKYIPDFDSILTVDASIMVHWDAPNYFDIGKGKMCGMRADENWKWTYESASGYQHLFPDVKFKYEDYFCSGMVMLRKKHQAFIEKYAQFYLDNHAEILRLEDEIVKRGRDQPVMNWMVQSEGIDFHHWSIDLAVNHLYRREILRGNWQYGTDQTPFFIKYFKAWQFSGFPDRGNTRSQLMSQTWEFIKDNYSG